MINIRKKEDIVIPASQVGDEKWLKDTRFVASSILACWGLNIDDIDFDLKSDDEIEALEESIGAKLPHSLRTFYQTFGVSDVGDKLHEFDFVGRLSDTWDLEAKPYCGPDFTEEELKIFPHLVTFTEHPGTNNMFCFHDETNEIYFLDQKNKPHIAKLFDSVDQFFMACSVACQIDLFDLEVGQEKVEGWIREVMTDLFGEKVLEKWSL